jgi:hypothetical protein
MPKTPPPGKQSNTPKKKPPLRGSGIPISERSEQLALELSILLTESESNPDPVKSDTNEARLPKESTPVDETRPSRKVPDSTASSNEDTEKGAE